MTTSARGTRPKKDRARRSDPVSSADWWPTWLEFGPYGISSGSSIVETWLSKRQRQRKRARADVTIDVDNRDI